MELLIPLLAIGFLAYTVIATATGGKLHARPPDARRSPPKSARGDGSCPRPGTPRPSPAPSKAAPARRNAFDADEKLAGTAVGAFSGRAYVVDGDTIRVKKKQIRLFGIDAPEVNHPHGNNATWALRKLCKGQMIRVEPVDEDAHGRLVGRCFLPDGRDLSAEMVRLGLAIDWPKFSGGRYRDMEVPGVRKKLWLADARQKGRMHVWEQFDYDQRPDHPYARK